MVATVVIRRYTGAAAGTTNDITSINTVGQTLDTHTATVGTSNPIKIPVSGTNYGYWVTTGLHVTVAPATAINNLRWYSDGANNFGTGVGLNVSTYARASYVQATGTANTTGLEMIAANYSGLPAPVSAFTLTSGSPLTVSGSIGVATGVLGDYVIYQFTVGTTATAGATAAETFTWAFDES